MIYPVILCGGAGTRLWPLSRKSYPKQFLDLQGSGASLLQQTLQRLDGIDSLAGATLVCSAENRFIVAQQMQEIGAEVAQILLEPEAKNTAPAVACAAIRLAAQDPDALMLVLPADHIIEDLSKFHSAIGSASAAAQQGYLTTFGITPVSPETGYGYIKTTRSEVAAGSVGIDSFVEKPGIQTAEAFLKEGGYLWNSGMFVFRAKTYLDILGEFELAMLEACQLAVERGREDLDFFCLDSQAFGGCPSNSIDYAVMEKASQRAVVAMDAGWSDVGSWSSLWEIGAKDAAGNVCLGDVIHIDSEDTYVHSQDRMVATIGLKDVVVVDTEDALLLADRSRVQDVKQVVQTLVSNSRPEAQNHRTVYRPWGSYTSICDADRFQVKRITVAPGQKLSLQKHHHRAEHWIVVKGTARVTCEDNVFTLSEDQSTYIPLGHKHRLENPGKIPLELIEVQSGSYLGEDDIVRYDDVYGREDQ